LFLLTANTWAVEPLETDPELRAMAQRMVQLTDAARRQQGLQPLLWVDYLEKAAKSHSQEMLSLGYFSHVSPTPGRTTAKMRIALMGGWDTMSGENIYRALTDEDAMALADRAFQQWFSSPAHRKNLLNPSYNSVGIGVVRKGEQFVITQDFSRQTIVVLSVNAQPAPGGVNLILEGQIREGSPEGAAFINDHLAATFQADSDSRFVLRVQAPANCTVAVSQKTAASHFHTNLMVPLDLVLSSPFVDGGSGSR
jgi:uncharacterized protein YkwD